MMEALTKGAPMQRAIAVCVLATGFSMLACGETRRSASTDSGVSGATDADSGSLDGGVPDDAPSDAPFDSGSGEDAGDSPPLVDVGGVCGGLGAQLASPDAHHVESTARFATGFSILHQDRLSPGAREILAEGTAGGSSRYSEAFAYQLLHQCEAATLLQSETEIVYSVSMPGSMTDMRVEMGGRHFGVSVTRAVTVTGECMRAERFSEARALDLLTDKLMGINESSMLVSPEHSWDKQVLFIFADSAAHADALREAWPILDVGLRSDTLVWVVVSEAMDGFIYFEDRC